MDEKFSAEAEMIAALAVQDGVPASGVVTGTVLALAASLLRIAADRSREAWPGAPGAVAQASTLRRRANVLAQENLHAYGDARAALAGQDPTRPASERRDWMLGRAVAAAADPPLALAGCAADVAQLALTLAGHGAPDVRADVVVAAELAAGAAAAAAHLVEVNLIVGADEDRVGRARDHVRAAAEAARAVASA